MPRPQATLWVVVHVLPVCPGRPTSFHSPVQRHGHQDDQQLQIAVVVSMRQNLSGGQAVDGWMNE